MKRSPDASITVREAREGIYVDFEGYADREPAIMGILQGADFEQVVLNRDLVSAAEAKGLRVSRLKCEIDRVLDICGDQQIPLVAYSQHERQVIQEYGDRDAASHYRDGRKIAKRWRNRHDPGSRDCGNGLKDFLELIDYPRPHYLGVRKSTSRLRAVEQMLSRREGRHDLLTATVKGQWTKLLEHNRVDCFGLRQLMLFATQELPLARAT